MLDGLSARELIWWKGFYIVEAEERNEEIEAARARAMGKR